MDVLKELNEIQGQAVSTIDGPVMIIAGPGSGKTRVLTYRMAFLIQQGIDPFRILSLTFTNKAAAEMRERIQHIVGNEAKNLFMGTFHSVFARILRMEASKLGYPSNFTIYDTDDAKSLLKSIIKEERLNDKIYKASNVYFRISSAKNSLIGPEDYQANADLVTEDEQMGKPFIGKLYEKYQRRLFVSGAMDFDDLLMKTHELLEVFPEVLYKYQNRFTHLMIDEFQDTNFAQYSIVKKLAAIHENICVVGDDAQSIYAFRGATIANILNFEKDYPDLKIFKLEQNYRSTPFIVHAANEVINKNKNQIRKLIWTEKAEGDKIKVFKAGTENEEARMVSESIFEQKMRMQLNNQDFAILYRTNSQSRAFEEALRRMNIPYRIYGGMSFYQRKEIKDFVAYLRLIINPKDEEALKRVLGLTKGIGQTSIDKVIVGASNNNTSIWDMILHPENIPQVTRNAYQILNHFKLMIQSFQAQLKSKNAFEIADMVGRQTGFVENLFLDKSNEGVSRYENVQELLNGIKAYTLSEKEIVEEDEVAPENDLAAYLQQISLLTDQDGEDKDPNKVKLMTIHASKGLEFPTVFVVGLEENLFPSMLSLNTRDELEEERRLFYVAITRAQDRLFLSYASSRVRFGTTQFNEISRFIEEVGFDNLDIQATKGLHPLSRQQSANLSRISTLEDNDDRKPWYLRKTKPSYSSQNSENSLKKLESEKQKAAFVPSDLRKIKIGDIVFHEKFYQGTVKELEGKGDNIMATIFFDAHGLKKIMLKFAKLQIINS
ncbi:MAG: UvrD-helicase domain-containing protein [Chitinophagales bacterium]|nr:UvrD-helicase domain-containing protein [Chitinophagales bacterium]MCZ2393959.1 UvrD-helicase domain-containing protein [Chitinophagales bacterium]